MNENKRIIIDRFNQNVRGQRADTTNSNQKHDGRDGHWLETQMKVAHNADNEPDLLGYEMKNQTTSGKISFGDWSADEYIFLHGRGSNKINSINRNYQISRDDFFRIFGKPNEKKGGRYSWSGTPCPTYYGDTTTFGQSLTMDSNDNIIITYNFVNDQRQNKLDIIPRNMQVNNLIIARWNLQSLQTKLERKFNQRGWFTCTKDSNGIYNRISFGSPINYDSWIQLFKNRIVFFDSGMHQGNSRNYSQWRASTAFWDSLIEESY